MDQNEFIAIFVAESKDNLTALDKGLVDLEKNPEELSIIREMNRQAHTIKGSARVLGYYEMQEVAHRIEDIFSKIADKELKFTSAVADTVFKGVDYIRNMVESVEKDEALDTEISMLCRNLEKVSNGEEIEEEKEKPIEEKEKPIEEEENPIDEEENPIEEEENPIDERGNKSLLSKSKIKQTGSSKIEEYIRVPLSRVNNLLNLVGELVINKMKSSQKINQARMISRSTKELLKNLGVIGEKLKQDSVGNRPVLKVYKECINSVKEVREVFLDLYDNISTESMHMDPVIDELQNKVKEIRMLPLSTIFEGYIRMVRDMARQMKKEVNFNIYGKETELDKKVLEGIKAPLMHILRNCIDHGIENPEMRKLKGKDPYGTITITAYHQAGNVVIDIEDDGKGIDVDVVKNIALTKGFVTEEELMDMDEKEIMNLVFINGFSTSPIITEISGRGVGVDIVRKEIEALKGKVSLSSEKDKGTKITLIMPLTIAIIQVLIIEVSKEVFAIPLLSIEECLKIKKNVVSSLEGRLVYQLRGHTVPLVKLADILKLTPSIDEEARTNEEGFKIKEDDEYLVIMASLLDKRVGFIVDNIVDQEKIFIKSLGGYLGKIDNISGVTILGSGDVVIILDIGGLITSSRLSHPALQARKILPKEKKAEKLILVVDDSLSTRELEKSILESQGYKIITAVDGIDALNKIRANRFDAIVSDVQMPRMDGFELCKSIKSDDKMKNLPVIMVTAMEKDEDKRRGIEVGAQAYIIKAAFDQKSLLDALDRLIG